ncbi:hypothetical protein ACGFJ7_04130 [Actinoplanes sp. NPDC048988]|uniref:hypothetical protein n=1 Tax=Actinoplanes sp. NPDC048988 TaxID=3363901 RepID=UPI00371CA17F
MLQIVGGVAAAGVIATGATALTGHGVAFGGSATPDQFVGGTIQQTVSGGATVTNVVYGRDLSGTKITSIAVTISGADTRYLTLTPTGTGFSTLSDGTSGDVADQWKCTGNISGTTVYHATAPKVLLTASPATVTCVPELTAGHVTQGWYKGLASLDMAVSVS